MPVSATTVFVDTVTADQQILDLMRAECYSLDGYAIQRKPKCNYMNTVITVFQDNYSVGGLQPEFNITRIPDSNPGSKLHEYWIPVFQDNSTNTGCATNVLLARSSAIIVVAHELPVSCRFLRLRISCASAAGSRPTERRTETETETPRVQHHLIQPTGGLRSTPHRRFSSG